MSALKEYLKRQDEFLNSMRDEVEVSSESLKHVTPNEGKTMVIKQEEKKGTQKRERRLKISDMQFEIPKDFNPYPLRMKGQVGALVNLCNVNQKPRHADAGFRILGLFQSKKEAIQYIQSNIRNPQENVYWIPCHELAPICKNYEDQLDDDYVKQITQEIKTTHSRVAAINVKKFKKKLQERKTQYMDYDKFDHDQMLHQTQEKQRQEQFQNIVNKFKLTIVKDTKVHQTKEQNFAVIGIHEDIRKWISTKEPLLVILACFEKEEEALNYAKYTASFEYEDISLLIVQMRKWLFVKSIKDLKCLIFRDKELNQIYQNKLLSEKASKEIEAQEKKEEKTAASSTEEKNAHHADQKTKENLKITHHKKDNLNDFTESQNANSGMANKKQ